ncbi:MAG: ABATE domain-containing protein, partial [Bacteroidota bacterium]|nr:ABATE domain-containing protein [Bacteroidota bacterium]
MAHQNTVETIPFDGGALCFDFVNTVRNRKVSVVHNYLTTYQNFLTWCRRIQMWPESLLDSLSTYSQTHPAKTEAALHNILSTRENLYLLFLAIAAESTPPPEILSTFNQNMAQALAQLALSFKDLEYEVQVSIK